MTKVMVGILSHNRLERMRRCFNSVIESKCKIDSIIVSDDASSEINLIAYQDYLPSPQHWLHSKKQAGVAGNSNRLINIARKNDIDVLFLLNDDIVVKAGVFDLYLDAIYNTRYHHFCFTDVNSAFKPVEVFEINGIQLKRRMFGDGVFLTITKDMIHCLGGFDTDFGLLGGEHYDYNRRAAAAGFCLNSLDVVAAQEYIFVEQYYSQVAPALNNVSECQKVGNMVWIDRMSRPPEIYKPII